MMDADALTTASNLLMDPSETASLSTLESKLCFYDLAAKIRRRVYQPVLKIVFQSQADSVLAPGWRKPPTLSPFMLLLSSWDQKPACYHPVAFDPTDVKCSHNNLGVKCSASKPRVSRQVRQELVPKYWQHQAPSFFWMNGKHAMTFLSTIGPLHPASLRWISIRLVEKVE